MTAPDFDAMGDEELAASAAGYMGWPEISANSPFSLYRDKGGVICEGVAMKFRATGTIPVDFDPASDLRHAAELGASFLAAWPDVVFDLNYGGREWYAIFVMPPERVDGEDSQWWDASHPSEARARTVSTLKAWSALNAK